MTELNQRLLLFGATGQVGSALLPRLRDRWDVVVARHADIDLADEKAIDGAVDDARPAVIVNAAAYTAVDRAESEPDAAAAINARAPGVMATIAKRVGAALVHFSTDYVFDGTKGAPYIESDAPAPLGVYGRTKLSGEQAIAKANPPHLIFRTSWVYSPSGRNFLLAITRRARETGIVRVVDDQIGAPTTAAAIAAGVAAILDRLGADGHLQRSCARVAGVYNLTAGGATSWYGFAREILRLLEIEATIEPISTEAFAAPAPRPRYSVLDNTKVARTFGVRLPSWEEQLRKTIPLLAP